MKCKKDEGQDKVNGESIVTNLYQLKMDGALFCVNGVVHGLG